MVFQPIVINLAQWQKGDNLKLAVWVEAGLLPGILRLTDRSDCC
jgi:hypothetical protein